MINVAEKKTGMEFVKALAKGTLDYDPDAHCDHHGHHHDGERGHDHCADYHCHGS